MSISLSDGAIRVPAQIKPGPAIYAAMQHKTNDKGKPGVCAKNVAVQQ
jgi:hypothetical protein